MKKFFLFAAALIVAVSSCTNNEADAPQINNEIRFQVVNYAAQTKANTQYPINYSFGAYAWFYDMIKEYPANASDAQVFMTNEKVSYDNDVPNYWKPEHTFYWPKSGHIDFISVSPWKATPLFTVTQNSISITDYTINQTDDLMYADKAIDQTTNVTTYFKPGVPTLFHHALAKVNFKVKQKEASSAGSTWTIAVKSLHLRGLAPSGSAAFSLNTTDYQTWNLPSHAQPGESVGAAVWDCNYNDISMSENKKWENSTAVTAEGKTIHGMQISTTAAYYSTGSAEAKNYFVIPQWLTNQNVEVVYDIITKLPNGSVIVEENVTKTVKLKSLTAPTWSINNNTTYTLTIGGSTLDPITFDPAVADWNDVAGDEIEI